MKEYFYEVDLNLESMGNYTLVSHNFPKIEALSPEPPNEIKWTPEHLLAASLSGSWMSTFISEAEKAKLDILSYQSQCFLKLEKLDDKYITKEILLRPTIKLASDILMPKAYKIIEEAEKRCPVKKVLNLNISIHPQFKYLRLEKIKQ